MVEFKRFVPQMLREMLGVPPANVAEVTQGKDFLTLEAVRAIAENEMFPKWQGRNPELEKVFPQRLSGYTSEGIMVQVQLGVNKGRVWGIGLPDEMYEDGGLILPGQVQSGHATCFELQQGQWAARGASFFTVDQATNTRIWIPKKPVVITPKNSQLFMSGLRQYLKFEGPKPKGLTAEQIPDDDFAREPHK